MNVVGSRVVFADELDRLDRLLPDHDVDVVDKEEAAREPFVDVGSGDRDWNLAHDVALGPPSAHQCAEALDLWAGRWSAGWGCRVIRASSLLPLLRCSVLVEVD